MEGSRPTRFNADEGWVLEYDRKTGHFYYFNTQTGESLWAEEADAEDPGEGKTGNDHVAVENYQQQQQHQTDDGSGMKRRGVKGEMGGGPTPYGDEVEDEVAEEGDNTIMLEASRHGAEVYKRTQAVVMAFTAMFFFHGCCCEGPMAVIEGALRAPLYFVGAVVHFVRGVITRDTSYIAEAALWLREGVLLLCATVTLLVPGLSLCIYRNFNADAEEWELSAIPTVVGKVDPRRFFTFSHGQGSMASNAFYDSDTGSMDSLGKQILHPPKSLVMTRHLDSGDDVAAMDGDQVEKGLEMRVKLSEENRAYQQVDNNTL